MAAIVIPNRVFDRVPLIILVYLDCHGYKPAWVSTVPSTQDEPLSCCSILYIIYKAGADLGIL